MCIGSSIENRTDLEFPQGSAAFPFRDWSIHGRLSVEAVSSAEASLSACLAPLSSLHMSRTIVSNLRLRHLDQRFDAKSCRTSEIRPPIEPSGSIRGQMLKKALQLQCYLH
jgi:hypothetical protein